jgi:hypothetical protein
MVTPQDIVNSAYKLKGACYRTWYYGASIPMWTDDNAGDPPPLAHLQYYGVMCSDLVNWALQDNGLPPGGGTAAFADYLVNTSDFDPTTPGVPGAIALSPYQSPVVGQQGHIAIYVDEHYLIQALHTPGITDQFTDAESYSWGGDTTFTTYGFLPGVDYSNGSNVDSGTHQVASATQDTYPGDTATPKDTASWMANVAYKQYGLPGILPVMTSCVELTQAFTGPGDVKDIPGYLNPVDGCSVGWFQQQADGLGCGTFGWGTKTQILDANYTLKRFCEEAAKLKGQYAENDPNQLGQWCQAVQRSGVPNAYRDKGYPIAKVLLSEWTPSKNGAVTTSPNWFGVGKDGVVRIGGDWSQGWLGQDTDGYIKYHAEYQKA